MDRTVSEPGHDKLLNVTKASAFVSGHFMCSPSAVLLLLTRADAEKFLAGPFTVNRILCLTPVARTVMDAAGRKVETSVMHFSERGHRRGLARCRRVERYLDTLFAGETNLHPGTQEALRQSLLQMTAVVSRIWCTVGSTGLWVIYDGEAWREVADRWAIASLVLNRIRQDLYFVSKWNRLVKTASASRLSLFAILNKCIVGLLSRISSIVIVKPNRGMKTFSAEIRSISSGTVTWSVVVAKKGFRTYWRTVGNLIKLLLRLMGQEITDAILVNVPVKRAPQSVERAIKGCLDGVPDRLVRQAALELYDDLVSYHLYIDSLGHEFSEYLRRIKPRFVLLWVMGGGVGPALAWAAARQQTPCWMLTASSISGGQADATSRYAAGLFAKFTGVSRLAHGNIVQSPTAICAAQDTVPEKPVIRSQPVVWMGRNWKAPGGQVRHAADRDRIILFLGNFSCWHDDHPWVWETADEFAHSMVELAQITSGIDRCRVIVRSKSKTDLDTRAMRYLVRDYTHCEIQASADITEDNKIPSLKDSIVQADLAVGLFSTTLEEAIHGGCPVLLWGGRQRYQHLRARFTSPSRDDRAAVYGVKRATDLRPMLEAILDAHAGIRLTDEEIRGYCWPQSAPNVSGLAKMLFEGNGRP